MYIFSAFWLLLYSLFLAKGMVRAARVLHGTMLTNVMRAPMSFFDTTPMGRILNRFSRDMDTVDNYLPQMVEVAITSVFIVLCGAVVIAVSTPLFLAVIIPLMILYYFMQVKYYTRL